MRGVSKARGAAPAELPAPGGRERPRHSEGRRAVPDHATPMPSLWRMATADGTPGSALWVALVVGTILTAINQGDTVVAGEMPDLAKAVLTYAVPYCVATYGAVTAKRAAWRRRHAAQGKPD